MKCNINIKSEIYKAFEKLGAPPELLAIIGSYHDTLPDEDILSMLKDYNKGLPTLHELH